MSFRFCNIELSLVENGPYGFSQPSSFQLNALQLQPLSIPIIFFKVKENNQNT